MAPGEVAGGKHCIVIWRLGAISFFLVRYTKQSVLIDPPITAAYRIKLAPI
jgi:hypothetical protein